MRDLEHSAETTRLSMTPPLEITMQDDHTCPTSIIRKAIQRALEIHGYFSNEDGRKSKEDKIDLQCALVEQLGPESCERELAVEFHEAGIPPPTPPTHLAPAKDVCQATGANRKIDILWRVNGCLVAIELKLRRVTRWSGSFSDGAILRPRKPVDTYGYLFLKDLHRLERLAAAHSSLGRAIPDRRFAVFLSNDPYEFEGRVPHDSLALYPRQLHSGHLAQFNHTNRVSGRPTSENTLWISYPPFHLSSAYHIDWITLDDDVSRFRSSTISIASYPASHLLIVEAMPQYPPTRIPATIMTMS